MSTRKSLLFAFLVLFGMASSTEAAEVLRATVAMKNEFKSPEALVEYYIRRDWYGAYITGMEPGERKRFTLWQKRRVHDQFLTAKSYKISKATPGPRPKTAIVEVTYDLVRLEDGLGATYDLRPGPLKRIFALIQDGQGAWRIITPTSEDAVPVLGSSSLPKPRKATAAPKAGKKATARR